jgi:hypothetical protein
MSPIQFKGTLGITLVDVIDTERYDHPEEEDPQASPVFDPIGTNCLEGRHG